MSNNKKIHFIYFESIDSTNTWVKANLHSLPPWTCVMALEQTAGRGRYGRRWVSSRGENIYATLFFTIPRAADYLHNIGQIAAYSCVSVLQQLGFAPQFKWPNDILIDQKKIGGILTEAVVMDNSIGVVLGIGFNVNMGDELLKTINQPATSLVVLSQKTWDIYQVLEQFLSQFSHDFGLLQKEGFVHFQASFENILAFKGEEIAVSHGTSVLKGICQSITEEGKLQLLLSSGECVTLAAGELEGLQK